jgi:uncharacterized 2Fe-2S/4Fe-4S cluster protein (DUF4445 family)
MTVPSTAPAPAHRIDVPALERHIECREDETVFAAARRAGVRIVGACGGRGSCGSCIVRVVEGRVHREGEGSHKKWLRACCVQPRSDLTLEIAPRSLAPVVRADVHTGGEHAPLPLDPAITAVELALPPATLQDLASDVDRMGRALAALAPPLVPQAIDAAACAALPGLLRQHGWQVQARLRRTGRGQEPMISDVARPGASLLGLAVDLGTTNAAAFLVDLASGQRLASLGLENPQVAWGADLISRINHAIADSATAEVLRRAAVGALQSLAHDLARAVGAQPLDIAEVTVCGNTAMQHLLAGWPVAQLGRAPFVAAAAQALDVAADRLGLALGPGAAVHLAPSIGGFVGGDHVAALLATEANWRQPGTTLLMDIGTNTEISLVHEGRILSASCPSGPALEGGHIGSGMRAAEGAIERVRGRRRRAAPAGHRRRCAGGPVRLGRARRAGRLRRCRLDRRARAHRGRPTWPHRRGRRAARHHPGRRGRGAAAPGSGGAPEPARRARGAAGQVGHPHRRAAAVCRSRAGRDRDRPPGHRRRFRCLRACRQRARHRPAAAAAAGALQPSRQCRRAGRAADAHVAAAPGSRR